MVLATNLAETSITIDDIVYVIDTGKVKVKSYDTLSGVSQLKAEWVSQVSGPLNDRVERNRCIFTTVSFSPDTRHHLCSGREEPDVVAMVSASTYFLGTGTQISRSFSCQKYSEFR